MGKRRNDAVLEEPPVHAKRIKFDEDFDENAPSENVEDNTYVEATTEPTEGGDAPTDSSRPNQKKFNSTKTAHLNFRKKTADGFRKKRGLIDLSRSYEMMSYAEACDLVRADPECGIRAVREKRHIALPYHLIHPEMLQKTCLYIANQTLGKYRKEVRGVVLAIANVKPITMPLVIDDQTVAHLTVAVTMAIFRPKVGQRYEARVTSTSQEFVTALLFDKITMLVPVDQDFMKRLKGNTLTDGDIISARYVSISLNRQLVQLRCTFHKLVRKGEPKTECYEGEAENGYAQNGNGGYAQRKKVVKQEPRTPVANSDGKKSKRTVFVPDSDSE